MSGREKTRRLEGTAAFDPRRTGAALVETGPERGSAVLPFRIGRRSPVV
ncbi:hypothetical protein [Natrinema salinisoli]|nr:hypothetical protein [Natrinema salinisoli]